MIDGKGTLYLLDLTGGALLQANQEIARLTDEITRLRAELEAASAPSGEADETSR